MKNSSAPPYSIRRWVFITAMMNADLQCSPSRLYPLCIAMPLNIYHYLSQKQDAIETKQILPIADCNIVTLQSTAL